MPIPSSKGPSPPPPLPPPRQIEELNQGGDPGWHFGNRGKDRHGGIASVSVKPGSSLLGGARSPHVKQYSGMQKDVDLKESHSPSSNATSSENNRIPDLAALLGDFNNSKLHGEKPLGQRSLEKSSQAYDQHVLSRIGGPRSPTRPSGGSFGASSKADALPSPTSLSRPENHFQPLPIPERRHSGLDPPQWPASANSAQFSPTHPIPQSPLSDSAMDSSLARRISGAALQKEYEGRLGQQGDKGHMKSPRRAEEAGGDHHIFPPLQLNDQSPTSTQSLRAGQKRKARSPPLEGVDVRPHTAGSNSDWKYHHSPSNGVNQPHLARLQAVPESLSSSASSALQSTSLASSANISHASSATSYSSGQPSSLYFRSSTKLQPGSLSTTQTSVSPTGLVQAPVSQQPTQFPTMPHRRQVSSGTRPPGLFICDCCPKKPKKFETEEDLRAHEMEKQYMCQFCNNRFKNKNEAERHQNSLHLRRHSWSCAALSSFEATFHPTTASASNIHVSTTSSDPSSYPPPSATDTCGYCGLEFPNPPNWDVRVEHLNTVHKFGECNQNKSFYRADHFRQHLKHSHGGTSGRWTNMLENACMREEPPPQPVIGQPGFQIAMAPPMAASGTSPGAANVATLPLAGEHPVTTAPQQANMTAQTVAHLPPKKLDETER